MRTPGTPGNPASSTTGRKFTVGYMIPEFPGQTHIWMWREIVHLKQWGVGIELFSTRRPGDQVRARHAFAEQAMRDTTYLWPQSPVSMACLFSWAVLTHPIGLIKCLMLALTIPIEGKRRIVTALGLLFPAIAWAKSAKSKGVDHLHCHTCASGAVLAMYVRQLVGIPFSMTLNADLPMWGGALREKFHHAAFTIAITQNLLVDAKREVPDLADDRIILGRIGVDTTHWVPGDRSDTINHTGPCRLITVGRLNKSKGHDILLQAIKILSQRGVEVKSRIIGAGPEDQNLRAMKDSLGLQSQVEFTGSLSEDQIIAAMRQSDIFVLASNAEPLGVVYMEAMAMEVTTIGTAAGGVAEIITTGADGILIPPRDAESLASAIEQLHKDPALRRQLGVAGRQKIIRLFDSRIGARTVYEKLLGPLPQNFVDALPKATEPAVAANTK